MREFIPPGINLNRVESCSPDANTQALLVTRYGYNSLNAQTARTYVENGGTIITEYSISHDIWTKVFGVNTARGARQGDCHDNAMPHRQLNPADPFWNRVAFSATPSNREGCGHSVSEFPGITPLGAWDSGAVQLGYRDLGQGRVFAVDADWQDNSDSWRPESTALMRAMVTW